MRLDGTNNIERYRYYSGDKKGIVVGLFTRMSVFLSIRLQFAENKKQM